jgi:hypothetical protein
LEGATELNSRDGYRKGDHWIVDDRSGERIRRSEARREYTGAVVHHADWESRHPQEYVRGKRDREAVKNPRPEPVDTFIGPLTTEINADAAAGAVSIGVLSSVRFEDGDHIEIMLDNSDRFAVVVQDVPDTSHLTLATPLPWSTSQGKRVTNVSAVTTADLG